MGLNFLGEVNFPMFKIKQWPLLLVSVLGYLTILLTFSGSLTPAYSQDFVRVIPSLGKGPYEVIMFADYFCPPCRRIDMKAESLLKALLATQQVKITFIDVPFNRTTPVYAKYYLYAVNADPGMNHVFHVRKTLFNAAQVNRIQEEGALVAYLNEQQIAWKAMNEKAVFPLMSAVIKENKVDATPTCVIRYSATDVKEYVGDDEIWDGLTKLKAHLSTVKK